MRHGVVMFHNGRCGSSVLGDMLGKHPQVHWDEEIFNAPNALQPELHKWQHWPRSPHFPGRPFRFLGDRVREARKPWYGFELQFYQLAEIGRTLDTFVEQVTRMGFRHFILLDRRNYLRVVTSNLVAVRKSKFRAQAGETPDLQTISVNVEQPYAAKGSLVDVFQKLDGTFACLRPLLQGEPVLELNYEDHILESPLVAYRKACEFIGVEPENPPVKLARTTPWPLRQVIENFDEVAAALRGTPYEWMTADELPAPNKVSAAGKRNPRNAIVTGTGRSGTSMLAGTLANAGYFVGGKPYPPRHSNPKGFFETGEVNGINERILARAIDSRRQGLSEGQRWLAVPTVPELEGMRIDDEDLQLMRRLVSRQPFCFKDPRFAWTLPLWDAELGDAMRLVVFRHPAVTAESIVRECQTVEYLNGVDMTHEKALALWAATYQRLIDLSRMNRGEWHFIHFDQLLQPQGLERLEGWTGTRVARDFPDAELSRSRAQAVVPESFASLYRELCDLAEWSPGDS